jgi:hypothetical protein
VVGVTAGPLDDQLARLRIVPERAQHRAVQLVQRLAPLADVVGIQRVVGT